MAIWISWKLRVVEFPTHYVGRNEGLSKLRPIDLMKASIAVFEIALRLHVLGFSRIEHPPLVSRVRLADRRGRDEHLSSAMTALEVGEDRATSSEVG